MTREEMYSLKEGDVVYCSQTSWIHRFYLGEKLTRLYGTRDDEDSLAFKGDSTIQYMVEDHVSFTNPLNDKND